MRADPLVLPLCTAEAAAGVLVVLRGSGTRPFTAEQLDMMAAFADQAVLAWQLAISQRRMRELDVLTDRDRIARDLHDHVIQRLFAVGLALQGTIPRARSAEVQQRLSGCVDDLHAVIQEIRTAIFDLHGASSEHTRLRRQRPRRSPSSRIRLAYHGAVPGTSFGGRRHIGRPRSRCARGGQQRRAAPAQQ